VLCRSEGNLKSPGHCGRAGSSPAPDTALVLKYSYMLFEARRIDSDFALFRIEDGALGCAARKPISPRIQRKGRTVVLSRQPPN